MMPQEYNPVCFPVNNHVCLPGYKDGCNFVAMKYGERLKAARKYANLTQPGLAERMNGCVTQQNISALENGDASGSEYTVQFAIACGVRPEWLALEQGEMVDGLYVQDERLKRAISLMQELPDYAVDEAIKGIDSIAKLTRKAAGEKK